MNRKCVCVFVVTFTSIAQLGVTVLCCGFASLYHPNYDYGIKYLHQPHLVEKTVRYWLVHVIQLNNFV